MQSNHHMGGPSRITGGSMIATREPLGSYADHIKYANAGSNANGATSAQISGAAQGVRSSSYAPRAPASSHGAVHSSQRVNGGAGNNHTRQSNMRSRE